MKLKNSQTKFKETKLDQIPEDWEVLKFNQIAELKKETYSPKAGDNLGYLGLEHIDQQSLSINSVGSSDSISSNKSKFESGDILFGKLRPYFKKIYQPKFAGICSTDMWVIKAKQGFDQDWLHWLVANQDFVDMASAGSKGTKMPRADWDQVAISEWPVPPLAEQKKIAEVLGALDEKIELNRKMNKTLESLAQAIFRKWFIDDESATVGKIGDVIEIFDSKRIPLSSREREDRKGPYPYYRATSIMGYVDEYIFDDTYLLLGEDGSVARDNGTAFTQYVWGKIWVNNHAHVIQGKNNFSTEIIKIFFDNLDIKPYVTGAVQQKLNQENLKNIPVNIPTDEILAKVNVAIIPLFEEIKINLCEIETLSQIRDSLLPRLMSGKLRVE